MNPDEINIGDVVISRTYEDLAEEWNRQHPDLPPAGGGGIDIGTYFTVEMGRYGGKPLHIAHKRKSKVYGWVFLVEENQYTYTAEMLAEVYSDIDPGYEAADITSLF